MKRILLIISVLLCGELVKAQPHELEGAWTGTFNNSGPILTDRGVVRAVRVQASATGSYGTLFNNSSNSYNPKWAASNTTPNAVDTRLTGGAVYFTSGGSDFHVSFTSGNYYTFIVGENAGSSNDVSVLETTFNPVSLSTVSASPSGNPYIGQDVEITITTSATPNANENIYVRYTTTGFSSSSFVQASGSGTTWTATIPAQAGGATVSYYVLSCENGITPSHADADFQSLEINNNSGSNWTYTQQNVYGNVANGVGSCNGNWNNTACWVNGSLPPSGSNVEIVENINLNVDATVNNITIAPSTNMSVTAGRTLTISSGGSITVNGTMNWPSPSTIDFAGSGTVSGTVSFRFVNINGGVNFGSSATILARMTINAGGFVNTNPPIYSASSSLRYNTGGTYGRSTEWSHVGSGTIGSTAGYPNRVEVYNNTTLNIEGGSPASSRACNAELDIESGSTANMGAMTANLIVGAVENQGTLNLSTGIGGDLQVGGTFNNSGTFNSNDREVVFNGTAATQTISGTMNGTGASNNFSFIRINKSAAGATVQMNTDVNVTDRLQLDDGFLNINGNVLYLDENATITGSPTDQNMIIATSGSVRREWTGTGSFTFPIGDNTGTAEYSPITLNFTSGTFSSAYAEVSVDNSKNSNNSSSTDYLSRSWTVNQSGISGFSCDVDMVYVDADVNGTEANIYSGKYSGSTWTLGSATNAATNTLSFNGATSFSTFTGGEQSALPVSLIAFHAKRMGAREVLISWSTASEMNNSHFELERSRDGEHFAQIAIIEGHGNTQQKIHYTWPDDAAGLSTVWYRLRQVDFDGQSEVFGPVRVLAENETEHSLRIYPQPVQSQINLEYFTEEADELKVVITNLAGAEVYRGAYRLKEGHNLFTINIEHLPNGMYLLQSSHSGEHLIQRMLKN